MHRITRPRPNRTRAAQRARILAAPRMVGTRTVPVLLDDLTARILADLDVSTSYR